MLCLVLEVVVMEMGVVVAVAPPLVLVVDPLRMIVAGRVT